MSESSVPKGQVKENPNRLNDLSGREWTSLSASVIDSREVSTPRKKEAVAHGATFPPLLAERIIRMYSKKGDMVLDPFMGTGTTLLAAKKLERRGFGIELYETFCQMARERLAQETLVSPSASIIIQGDCREVLRTIDDNMVQLCFTSPPYANFIRKSLKKNPRTNPNDTLVKNKSFIKPYGDDPKDFGNLEYSPFLVEVGVLMSKLYRVLKPGGYNIWVVKDYRDSKAHIPLIPFHSDLAYLGEQTGFTLSDFIIWNQNFGRKLLILGFPTTFYVNLNHNFLVVLRKPKAK